MKKHYNLQLFKKQKGMSVAIIIASIVVLGVLGYIGSSIFTAIVGGNQRANLVIQSGQNLTQASFILTTEAAKNASGIPVALAYAGGSPAPIGGGIIPATSAAPKIDSFGTNIGYCTNNAVAQNDPVFAVISAGSNKVFDTNCTQALAGTKINDDKVMLKSVGNILQGVGGTVYFGDPVAVVTDLANLSAVKPGQLRTVLADGSVWVNKTGAVGASNWTQAGSVSGGGGGGTAGGGPTLMYLVGMPNFGGGAPSLCPTGWTEADYKVKDLSLGFPVYKRTCTNTSPFAIMYLEGMPNFGGGEPSVCPTGWTEVDYKVTDYPDYPVYTRTCFKAATAATGGSGGSSSGACGNLDNFSYLYMDDAGNTQGKNLMTSGVVPVGTKFVELTCGGSRVRMSLQAWNSGFSGTTRVSPLSGCSDGLNAINASLFQCEATTPFSNEFVTKNSLYRHYFSGAVSVAWTAM